MKKMLSITAALALAAALGAGPASAASGDTYKAKKQACQDRAKSMNFGVHLIKKNRWVKDCIAGRHSA
ncbi:MAG TPA: hypothetical protein VFU97_20265 [Xanthobacteraceae bacterium]|jgi:hypothetical protein|nr:hypothetical protein [Xanthobacteraceae bacterium]